MSFDVIARGLANRAQADLAQLGRSANTRSLIAAIRSNGMFPKPLALAPAADVPAVTLGAANAASALNGRAAGNPLVLLSDARLQWLSGPRSQDSNQAWQSRGAWYGASRDSSYASFEFVHVGTSFELCFVASFASSTNNLRILVDDRVVWSGSMPQATGNLHYLGLTFPGLRTRRIRVEGAHGRYRGINVANGAEIAATGRSYPLIAVMGDSFVEGTGAAQFQDGEAVSLVRCLGGSIALGGVGGTGLLNPGTGGRVAWTDPVRMTDLTMAGVVDALGAATAPMLGIVMMSLNDQGLANAFWSPFGSSFQDAIRNRALALIDGWKAANPGKPLVVFGPTWTSGTPLLDIYRLRDAAMEACWSESAANVWFIDRLSPATALRSGNRSFTSTTGSLTTGSAVIPGIPSTIGVTVSAGIEGAGIPAGARVVSVDSTTQVTISSPATVTGTATPIVFRNDQAALYQFGLTDITNPSQAGHNLDALWMAQQLRGLILGQFA